MSYKIYTKEETDQLELIKDEPKEQPGEGTYPAYFKSVNKNYMSVKFRMPQDIVDQLKPDTDKLEALIDEACQLYVKSWKLADARCRTLIQKKSSGTSARDTGKSLEYTREQSSIYRRFLEIESEMDKINYEQYEKGLETGKIPEEVAEPMRKALAAYKEIGMILQNKFISDAKSNEARLGKLLEHGNLDVSDKDADIVTECIKTQQGAYKASRPMTLITDIKPFYNGNWSYYGRRAVSTEDYMFALNHSIAWAKASANGTDFNGNSPEAFDSIRPGVKAEYGL